MRPFEDDLPFLTGYQRNWVHRFYRSWHFKKFLKTNSVTAKKHLLSAYLTGLVAVLKDARNEISFLRKFLDRSQVFTARLS